MPTFTMTKNWDDGTVLTESQLDDIKNSVETFLNVTKLDGDNIATSGIATANIADGSITSAKLAAAIAGDGLAGGAGSALSVNTDGSTIETSADALRVKDAGITAAKLATDSVTTAKILALNVTSAKINDLAVTTGKINDAAVTADKLAAAVAGNGLAGGAGTALSVNVDDSTIELNTDALRVKDAGITSAKLAAAVAGNGLAGGAGTALSVNVDDSTIEINSDTLRVKALGITKAKLAALGQQVSSDSGSFSHSNSTPADVVTAASITTSGRPVFIALVPATTGTATIASSAGTGFLEFRRDSTTIGTLQLVGGWPTEPDLNGYIASIFNIDIVAAGTYVYKVRAYSAITETVSLTDVRLVVFEL